jgi:AcrR family transcriptional regulator
MGAKTSRRHVQGDESREKILDATIEIAALRGYHGTSIALVSKHSGLPASSIYWHFKNKDDLFAAVIERSFDRWLTNSLQLIFRRPTTGLREHFVANMMAQADELRLNPEFLRLGLLLSLEEHPDEPSARAMFLRVRQHAHEALFKSFADAFEDSGTPNVVRARHVATLVMAATDGLFIAAQVTENFDLSSELELLGEVVYGLVKGSFETTTPG